MAYPKSETDVSFFNLVRHNLMTSRTIKNKSRKNRHDLFYGEFSCSAKS